MSRTSRAECYLLGLWRGADMFIHTLSLAELSIICEWQQFAIAEADVACSTDSVIMLTSVSDLFPLSNT